MHKLVFTLTLILLSPIFELPTIANPHRSPQVATKKDEYKYEYADGAGNLYIIDRRSIEYRPVARSESSSLNYDGGQPRTVKIDLSQYQTISVNLDRAFNLKSIHVKNNDNMGRSKGTGLISKQAKNRQIQSRIISQNSQERQEIEALLERLIRR